jgi:hypothetical protein
MIPIVFEIIVENMPNPLHQIITDHLPPIDYMARRYTQ